MPLQSNCSVTPAVEHVQPVASLTHFQTTMKQLLLLLLPGRPSMALSTPQVSATCQEAMIVQPSNRSPRSWCTVQVSAYMPAPIRMLITPIDLEIGMAFNESRNGLRRLDMGHRIIDDQI